jgi:two-component system, OmpR family, phosphate regulon response regulator PhoB
MAAKILVFQDKDPIVDQLTEQLRIAGYDVVMADWALCPVQTVTEIRPDIIVIDWMLPNVLDIDLCRRIRAQTKAWSPLIMMLSACKSEPACLSGFEAGTDDYVVKPASTAEFLARVNALLRRGSARKSPNDQEHCRINIDHDAHRVTRRGRQLKLSPIEYRMLQCFMDRAGRVVTRAQLLEYAWSVGASDIEERTVDVHIGRLREAIVLGDEPDPIRTVRGEGYIFDEAT